MMMKRVGRLSIAALLWSVCATTAAFAQTTKAGVTSPPVAFGAWLDDANTLTKGLTSVGLGVGRWSGIYGGETDGPVFDVSVGAAQRVQLGISVPFYHASYTDGSLSSGRGDIYMTAKVQLVNPHDRWVGVSMTPLLEVLSDAELADVTLGLTRINWALPVSVQVGTGQTQAFGTIGYFSRGATFAGLGVTRAVNDQLSITGSFTVSHSMNSPSTASRAGLSRTRADANAGLSITLSPRVGLWASVGRTVSTLDQNGASFTGSATVSVLLGKFQQ